MLPVSASSGITRRDVRRCEYRAVRSLAQRVRTDGNDCGWRIEVKLLENRLNRSWNVVKYRSLELFVPSYNFVICLQQEATEVQRQRALSEPGVRKDMSRNRSEESDLHDRPAGIQLVVEQVVYGIDRITQSEAIHLLILPYLYCTCRPLPQNREAASHRHPHCQNPV